MAQIRLPTAAIVRALVGTVCIALGGVAAPAWSQVYKWVDEKGVTHYSESPPAAKEGKASLLNMPDAAPTKNGASTASDQNWQAKDLEFRARQAKEADARKKEEDRTEKEALARQRACLGARGRLDALGRARVYNVNDRGERVYLSDDERARETQQANQQVAENCSP